MPDQARGLLLDLDGTLIDSIPFLCDSFRAAIAPWVRTQPDNVAIVATFGPPERENIRQVLANPTYGKPGALDFLDEATERFMVYYETHAERIHVFPGVMDAVREAAERGWRLGVFTGKGRRLAEHSVHHLGLHKSLRALVAGTDVKQSKPYPEGVFRAATEMGLETQRILLLGDSAADVRAGNSAGSQTGAALWGAFDQADTLHANPTWAFANVATFRTWLREQG